jgi:cyclophilin family peptidyl-prolyl cis-trans isomerase
MANPVVVLETTKGTIKARLDEEKAPITVANFLNYLRSGHYDGTIFHRVIPNFMVQGGGMTEDMREKRGGNPIKNEAGNGLKNERGTLAMARTSVVDSATAQFFINVKNNEFLNHQDETSRGFGYAVFGEVIEGMDVVDKIVAAPTTSKGGHNDVPRDPITITSARVEE